MSQLKKIQNNQNMFDRLIKNRNGQKLQQLKNKINIYGQKMIHSNQSKGLNIDRNQNNLNHRLIKQIESKLNFNKYFYMIYDIDVQLSKHECPDEQSASQSEYQIFRKDDEVEQE